MHAPLPRGSECAGAHLQPPPSQCRLVHVLSDVVTWQLTDQQLGVSNVACLHCAIERTQDLIMTRASCPLPRSSLEILLPLHRSWTRCTGRSRRASSARRRLAHGSSVRSCLSVRIFPTAVQATDGTGLARLVGCGGSGWVRQRRLMPRRA